MTPEIIPTAPLQRPLDGDARRAVLLLAHANRDLEALRVPPSLVALRANIVFAVRLQKGTRVGLVPCSRRRTCPLPLGLTYQTLIAGTNRAASVSFCVGQRGRAHGGERSRCPHCLQIAEPYAEMDGELAGVSCMLALPDTRHALHTSVGQLGAACCGLSAARRRKKELLESLR